jgi:hypothetical protein
MVLNFTPGVANSGATTIAVSGLTTKSITKCGTTALVANDLTTTAIAVILYDGTEFQLLNPQATGCGAASVASVNTYVMSQGSTTATLAGASVAGTTWGYGFLAQASGTYGHMCVQVSNIDGTNTYEYGFYNSSGTQLAHTTAATEPSVGISCHALNVSVSFVQGSEYALASSALTVNTASYTTPGNSVFVFAFSQMAASVFPASLSIPTTAYAVIPISGSGGGPTFYLYP